MADIERAVERASNGGGHDRSGGDLNRASGRTRRGSSSGQRRNDSRGGGGQRIQISGSAPAPRQSPSAGRGGAGRQFRGRGGYTTGPPTGGGGSRKAEARGGVSAEFFGEGDFSPSSGSESESFHDHYHRASPSSSSPARGGAQQQQQQQQQHRFNVNAPSFRPSPASGGGPVSISLSASAPGLAVGAFASPLPREVPPEEPRRRDRKEKKLSRSDHFRVPANYLLNFTYERPTHDWSAPAPRRRAPVVEFKKERFLQANYRFVVNAGGDYVRHLYETDQLVDWDEIEQIVLQTSVPYNCPICLDAPMAPKMTKCGHIYCWSCINRYLGMAQKGWRKCPICFDSVSTKHLKSTAIELVPEHREGEPIAFTLMRRYKDCTVALPSERWRTMEALLRHDDRDSNFSRLVLVEDITPILDKEQQDLNEALALARASQDYEPVPYIEAALHSLQERRETFAARNLENLKLEIPTVAGAWSDEEKEKETEKEKESKSRRRSRPTSEDEAKAAAGEEDGEEEADEEDEEDLDAGEDEEEEEGGGEEEGRKKKKKKTTAVTASPDIYYFYQASDGQNIFMHPLNFRCLHKEVGSFDKLPHTVEAKVLQLEEVTQNEKMRKRRKMIVGHLPLSTQFQFCEVGLGHLVSDRTLASFADEFKFRETKRDQIKKERASDSSDHPAPPPPPKPASTADSSTGIVVDHDPLLAAALEESMRMADAATTTTTTPPMTSSASDSSADSSGLQGAWLAKKQLTTATAGVPTTGGSSRNKPTAPPASAPAAKTPTFSQVASNAVWSGWKDEAFPTVDAAGQATGTGKKKGDGGGGSGAGGAGAGQKQKKKKQQILLVSNAGGRRY